MNKSIYSTKYVKIVNFEWGEGEIAYIDKVCRKCVSWLADGVNEILNKSKEIGIESVLAREQIDGYQKKLTSMVKKSERLWGEFLKAKQNLDNQ